MASLQPFPGREPRYPLDSHPRRIGQLARLLRDLGGQGLRTASLAGEQLLALAPTPGELVALLSDRSPFVRSGAAWWLRHLKGDVPATVISALRAAIHDLNPHVVQAALGSAGILRLGAARDDVRNSLDDSHPGVVHQAIFALGRIGPAEEGRRLVRFLRSGQPHLEKAAIAAITSLRYQAAIPELIDRLNSYRGAVRRLRSHFELPRRYMHALATLGAREAIPLLIHIASDEVGLRGLAVQALITLRAEEAAPALLPLLEKLVNSSGEEKLCCSLLYLMTAVDYRFAMPQVRAFLSHRLSAVRIAALHAVARWRDQEAIAVVRTMANQDVSAFVRPVAVTTLVELAGIHALADLESLTEDANSLVRAAVAEALSELNPMLPSAAGALVKLAQSGGARGGAPPPVPRPATKTKTKGVVPGELRGQAVAARAFMRHWRSGLGDSTSDLACALDTILAALEEGQSPTPPPAS